MTCCGIWGHAKNIQQRELRQACRRNRRLGILHRGELGLLGIRRCCVERRLGEHHTVKVGEIAVEGVPHRDRLGKRQCQVGAHPDVLAALAREQIGGLAVAARTDTHGDVGVAELVGRTVGERAAQSLGQCAQRSGVRGDQTRARVLRSVEGARGVERDPRKTLSGVQGSGDLTDPLLEVGR